MSTPPSRPPEADELFDLARRDRTAAGKVMAELDAGAQVELVCSAPAGRRAELLDLSPEPDALVAKLPEAELCFTVKAIGLESATWLLEYATPEQVTACLDLDAWSGHEPDLEKLDAWVEALAETSDDRLQGSLEAIDPELLVLYLGARIAVYQKPEGEDDWQPPAGTRTIDGQFHFAALREGDDLAGLLRSLHLLFQREYWTYFRLMQGVVWELPTETVEWARRWRTGRLQDLGFPSWDEAMGLYRFLAPEDCGSLPDAGDALDVAEWHLPVWIPQLPEGADSRHLLFRALAGLEPEERRAAFYAFVAVANQVAVADRMELSDAETTPRTIDKAAHWISRGLEYVSAEAGLSAVQTLRRAPMSWLFRVGVNLEPDAARS